MITHVIVELDAPIEEKGWHDDDKWSSEYCGRGKPLTLCKVCESHGTRTNMCDIWHRHTSPDGFCHRAKAVKKGDTE